MHIFLTGGIQVGKTTIIRSFLSDTGLSADGFMSYWESDGSGSRNLCLSPYKLKVPAVVTNESAKLHPPNDETKKHIIIRDGETWHTQSENVRNVFDIHGVAILKDSGKRDVVVMDELGFLESKSALFQSAVLWHISAAKPVLGVIKPARNAFLDTIRAHPNVTVRKVTEENRGSVLEWLLSEFKYGS